MVYNLERLMHEERIEGLTEGLTKGLSEGHTKGLTEGRLEIAEKMFRKGMNIDEIVEITGISKEDLEKFKEKN